MELNELLALAWEAVERSGVPESLQETAFREAVGYLREESSPAEGGSVEGRAAGRAADAARGRSGKPKAATERGRTEGADALPDEATFFGELARESGVDETDLRDILQLTPDRKVQVTPPTKDLGKGTSDAARTVVSLVASARAIGLGESPVNAEAVRREVERKRVLDVNNFASKVLRPLKGFNAGSNRNELVMTSKWVGEFTAAVDQAHGRKPSNDGAS